jgi:hypothetical protein
VSRDTQRQRVYNAERRAFADFHDPTMETIVECWQFAQKVIGSAMFKRSFPRHHDRFASNSKYPWALAQDYHGYEWVEMFDKRGERIWPYRVTRIANPGGGGLVIRNGQGTRIARGGSDWGGNANLNLPAWARSKHVVLHELAHAVAPHGSVHGWRFCEIYLRLVHIGMGKDAMLRLKAEFDKPGRDRVRYRKPRAKRELTPEQKAELTERLTKARAAKAAQREDADART